MRGGDFYPRVGGRGPALAARKIKLFEASKFSVANIRALY
jgi:hypothetical protein